MEETYKDLQKAIKGYIRQLKEEFVDYFIEEAWECMNDKYEEFDALRFPDEPNAEIIAQLRKVFASKYHEDMEDFIRCVTHNERVLEEGVDKLASLMEMEERKRTVAEEAAK